MKKENKSADEVKSPCISICAMDEETGYCRGCLRTLDEITRWERLSRPQKQAVLDDLRQRRKEHSTETYSQDC